MRRLTAIALLAAAAFFLGASAASAAGLRAVEFISANTGWAAGDGVIVATSDGGRSWHSQYTGRVQFSSLHFVNALVGWASGVDPIPGAGVLMGTHDGGHTWSKLGEPRNPVRSISFANPLLGFAVAGGSPLQAWATERTPAFFGGRLARSMDGGRSWSMLDHPMLVDTTCASSEQRSWAAYQAAVLRSDDSGETFSNVFSPHLDTHLVWYASLHCVGDDVAWVQFASTPVADERPYLVFRTTDGGEHWQPMLLSKHTPDADPPEYNRAGVGPGPWPGPFAVVDANTAFFLGACRQCGAHGALSITGTSDGGASWQAVATIPDVTLNGPVALSFADASHGWVVGSGANGEAVIEASADGGLTWTRQMLK